MIRFTTKLKTVIDGQDVQYLLVYSVTEKKIELVILLWYHLLDQTFIII